MEYYKKIAWIVVLLTLGLFMGLVIGDSLEKTEWGIGTCLVGEKEVYYIIDSTFQRDINGIAITQQNCNRIVDERRMKDFEGGK